MRSDVEIKVSPRVAEFPLRFFRAHPLNVRIRIALVKKILRAKTF